MTKDQWRITMNAFRKDRDTYCHTECYDPNDLETKSFMSTCSGCEEINQIYYGHFPLNENGDQEDVNN
jgi:hypothetical protein